jgi:hypothetical protein
MLDGPIFWRCSINSHLLGVMTEKSCAGDEKVKTATGSEGLPERMALVALSKASSSEASLSALI